MKKRGEIEKNEIKNVENGILCEDFIMTANEGMRGEGGFFRRT